ncbi:hypothetical protein AB835_12225 [Candidatus Endobugula sertula]|uniref:DUF3135 domain-containing protein n=1 Tax=Candidatus Endobugula sertula TaxID=62101 RepID=A0A1D2QMI2_9GAMM|nr:hypothetical protein AB835_12225 [Candidatus Endobugula sertula]
MSDLPKFDELVKLAQENPEALEKLRQEHINRTIENAPKAYKHRLQGLQFQIDSQRQIHKNSPLGACIKISQMMNESFAEFRSWLNQASGVNDPLRELVQETEEREAKSANILAFPSN